MGSARAEPGSFRDPDSGVFYVDDRVLRGLSARAAADWEMLRSKSFFTRLVDDGVLIGTHEWTGDPPASPRGDAWQAVLEHERVPFVSYPYEWPFAMLRDAARCHLDVLIAALEEGMTLKDGTAYNLQFIGRRPVFVDVGSFEVAAGPWPGYRQFCRTMLFPLLVQAHLGIAFQPLLRGALEGPTPADVSAMFKGRRKWKKGVLRNVTLHALVDRKVTASTEVTKERLQRAGYGRELALATARKLRKLVDRLEVKRSGSVWSDYRDTCSYTDDDAAAKREVVERVCGAHPGAPMLDLGANDGAYSLVAAGHASHVVAVDLDEAVIDGFYRRLCRDGVDNVLPLVGNLVDPSPGLGWRNLERAPFEARADADVVLALALVHHLAIGANIPLPEIVRWLAEFDATVVVEFPHHDDPMVRRLLANKPAGLFDDYRRDHFEQLVGKELGISRSVTLPGGTRTMYVAEPGPR